jgi:hypothetical protein
MILVRSVKPLERFQVLLEFSNGEQKKIDLEPFLRGPIFAPLKNNRELFQTIHVDEDLGTIVWDNGADMDPDVLYGTYLPAWMETEKKIVA